MEPEIGSADQSLLLVLEEDLPLVLAPEEGELPSGRRGTGEGLGGQGLTVCVKYAVGAGGRCRDHGGMEGVSPVQ